MTDSDSVPGACPHDCPDTCAWTVTVRGGKAVTLRGDPDHPFTRGGLCAKVNRYLEDRVYHPDRLLHPLRRVGDKGEGRFERVSWDEALDAVAARFRDILAGDGPTAILPYSYMGTQGLVQAASLDRRFFARLGATRLIRAVCGSAASSGVAATLGTHMTLVPEDIVHSRHIILWGTNTIVTNLHLWPFIREAREHGARLVVIDPIRTRTAAAADLHLQPRPGTDAALALGMMYVIVREGLHDRDYVERYTLGFDRLQERIAEYPPERAAEITGLDAATIVDLARAYAGVRPSVIRSLIGMEHHTHGAMTLRTVACLPALVGAWRDRGGGLLFVTSRPFFEALNRKAIEMRELEDTTLRQINMVQIGQALTDPALAPPIRALVVYNSNPAAIAPNQNLVRKGLAREDLFTVVLEHFLTDTARYADYVFPATTQVEHWDLVPAWGHTYLSLNRPAIDPVGEALPNTEFFRRLASRLGMNEPYLHISDEDIIRQALGTGHPYLEGITFEGLCRTGWARLRLPEDRLPFAEGNFPTRSGKCEFVAEQLVARGQDPLPAYHPPRGEDMESGVGRYPLHLLTPKMALQFLNSSYANLLRHRKAEGEARLQMDPADAAPRGIRDGDPVRVRNERGSIRVRAAVGDCVRPGTVALPSGYWASLSPGGVSANALTADGVTDLGDGGDFHDTFVEVETL